jgi:pimeloyl-ACP methyl ester carboxylesterase
MAVSAMTRFRPCRRGELKQAKLCPLVLAIVLALILTLAACDIPPEDTPEPPSTPTLVIIAASRTVVPVPPTVVTLVGGNIGDDKFTPGAGQLSPSNPEVTITPTPAATEVALPLQFSTDDGLVIAGTLFAASRRPAPTVLLLHALGSNKESWVQFALQLQTAGYNALAIDLRGFGATGGKIDWNKVPGDVNTVLTRLVTLPGVDPQRISIVGADIGANVALGACTELTGCRTVVLLSPGLDYQGVKAADALMRYGRRSALIVASRADTPSGTDSVALDKVAQGDHKLQLYEGKAHGTALLSAQPDLPKLIIQWLGSRNG